MTHAARGIRFITPDYNEKFRIDDGDSIRMMREGQVLRICRKNENDGSHRHSYPILSP